MGKEKTHFESVKNTNRSKKDHYKNNKIHQQHTSKEQILSNITPKNQHTSNEGRRTRDGRGEQKA
jgi:hypothetical protein